MLAAGRFVPICQVCHKKSPPSCSYPNMQCLNDLNGTPDEFQPYLTSPSLSPRSCEDQGWLCSLGMHHTKTKSPFPPEKKMPRHRWVRLRIVYSFNPTGSLSSFSLIKIATLDLFGGILHFQTISMTYADGPCPANSMCSHHLFQDLGTAWEKTSLTGKNHMFWWMLSETDMFLGQYGFTEMCV